MSTTIVHLFSFRHLTIYIVIEQNSIDSINTSTCSNKNNNKNQTKTKQTKQNKQQQKHGDKCATWLRHIHKNKHFLYTAYIQLKITPEKYLLHNYHSADMLYHYGIIK